VLLSLLRRSIIRRRLLRSHGIFEMMLVYDLQESHLGSIREQMMQRGAGLKKSIRAAKLIIFAIATARHLYAHGQASPTATQQLQLSTFAGASGTSTGLNSGKSVATTVGVDLGFRSLFTLHPFLEARGTYPIDKGQVDSQKNALGGLKIAKTFGRFNPYVDILLGRGEIYYVSSSFSYFKSPAHVLSSGAGLEMALTDHFLIKADAQFQRSSSPVTESGYIYAVAGTIGLVYRFHFSHYLPQ
jgi:hypothetical protein